MTDNYGCPDVVMGRSLCFTPVIFEAKECPPVGPLPGCGNVV